MLEEVQVDPYTERLGRPLEHTTAVDLQLAIFDIVEQARGLSFREAREIFAEELSARKITPPSGLWIDAAMTSAALGNHYIISNEARWGAEIALEHREQENGPRQERRA
ncbi:hypothetical protein [Arthrobacter sp. CP30]